MRVTVHDNEIVRSNAPRELFGFNVPWRDFQLGFMKNGAVQPELIELLKVFEGAAYRFPGGSPSNSFNWRAAAAPLAQRAKQHADYDNYATPELGPREFAAFVSAVGGRAILTLNVIGPDKKILDLDELRQDARETAQTLKSISGFDCAGESGCMLMALELGNEIDWQPYNMSARNYAERAEVVRAEVGAAWPKATWVANGRSAPWDSDRAMAQLQRRSRACACRPGLRHRVPSVLRRHIGPGSARLRARLRGGMAGRTARWQRLRDRACALALDASERPMEGKLV